MAKPQSHHHPLASSGRGNGISSLCGRHCRLPPTPRFSVCLPNRTLCSAKVRYFLASQQNWDDVLANETAAECAACSNHLQASSCPADDMQSTLSCPLAPCLLMPALASTEGAEEDKTVRGLCVSAHSFWAPYVHLEETVPGSCFSLLGPGTTSLRTNLNPILQLT